MIYAAVVAQAIHPIVLHLVALVLRPLAVRPNIAMVQYFVSSKRVADEDISGHELRISGSLTFSDEVSRADDAVVFDLVVLKHVLPPFGYGQLVLPYKRCG